MENNEEVIDTEITDEDFFENEEEINIEEIEDNLEIEPRKKLSPLTIILCAIIALLIAAIAYMNFAPHNYEISSIFSLEEAHYITLPVDYRIDSTGTILKENSNRIYDTIGQIQLNAADEDTWNQIYTTYTLYGFIEQELYGHNVLYLEQSDETSSIHYYIFYENSIMFQAVLQDLDANIEETIISSIK